MYVLLNSDGSIAASADHKFPGSVKVDYNVVRGYDGKLYKEDECPTKPESLVKREAAEAEIAELQKWFAENDYKQFKYLRGEYTDEEWAAIKAEFQAKAARISELREAE